jgi:YD repeat-containing protein
MFVKHLKLSIAAIMFSCYPALAQAQNTAADVNDESTASSTESHLNIANTASNSKYASEDIFSSGLLKNVGLREGGVNLYTGKVQLSIEIEGLSLAYNGNVKRILSAPNNYIQSSKVGVGWVLELGYIRATKNNTAEITDDEYHYVTENGFSAKLIADDEENDLFVLKDYKFWKIKRITGVNPDNNITDIKSWQVIREDGSKFIYGDGKFGYGTKNANRNNISWGNWIGNGNINIGSTYTAYCWDLAEVINSHGETIQEIYYQQEKEGLAGGSLQYTKASYPKKIIDPKTGIELHFFTEDREKREWKDQYPFNELNGKERTSGDGFIEFYETKYISKIEKRRKSSLIKTYELKYRTVDAGFNGENRGKRFLTAIIEKNWSGNSLPGHRFEYLCINDNGGNPTPVADDINKGALCKITYPTGGSASFSYNQISNDDNDLLFKGNSDDLTQIYPASELGGIELNQSSQIFMNKEHLIVVDKKQGTGFVRAWHWTGNEWVGKNFYLSVGANQYFEPFLFGLSGNKFIAIARRALSSSPEPWPGSYTGKVSVWRWDGEEWSLQDYYEKFIYFRPLNGNENIRNSKPDPQMNLNNNHLTIVGVDSGSANCVARDAQRDYIVGTQHWDGNNWSAFSALPGSPFDTFCYFEPYELRSTENHIIMLNVDGDDYGNLMAWRWDGQNWSNPIILQDEIVCSPYKPTIKLNNNLLVLLYHDDPRNLHHPAIAKTWFWNGEDWIPKTLPLDGETFMVNETPPLVEFHNNKLAIFSNTGNLFVWLWDGGGWIPQGDQNSPIVYQGTYWQHKESALPINRLKMNDNMIVFIDVEQHHGYPIGWTGGLKSWMWKGDQLGGVKHIINDVNYTTSFTGGVSLSMTMNNAITLVDASELPCDSEDCYRVRVWDYDHNSEQWTINNTNNLEDWGAGSLFPAEVKVALFGDKVIGGSQSLRSRFAYDNDWSGMVKDFRVNSKIVNNGKGDISTINYDYENGLFDMNMESGLYNKVTVTYPNKGKSIKYFYNDLNPDEMEEYVEANKPKELEGKEYRIKHLNSDDAEISETENYWHIVEKPLPLDQAIYYSQINKISVVKDGVEKNILLEYNDNNGLSSKKIETNSGGGKRITEVEYAMDKIGAMKDNNMLTPVYSTTVKEDNSNVEAKQWTEWRGENGTFVKDKEWLWIGNGSLDDKSAPNDPGGSETQLNLVYNKYNSSGRITEQTDANGIKTSIKYGYNNTLPIAQINNASNAETFVDDFGEGGLVGWIKNDVNGDGDSRWSVQNEQLKLVNYASATNNECDRIYFDNGLEISGSVVLEFDVTVANSNSWDLTISMGGSSWGAGNGGSENAVWTSINNENWRYYSGGWNTIKSALNVGETYHFRIVADCNANKADFYVDGEKLATGANFRYGSSGIQKIAFGNYGYGSVTTTWYIDNVRLYPGDTACRSQSYDPKLLQVNSQSDENGNRKFYEYDDFGRLKSERNNDNAVVKAYDYYYSRSGNGGEYNPADPNSITTGTETFNHEFEYTNSPLYNKWRIYDPSGSLQTIYDSELDSRVLRTTTSEGTGFGIIYPSSGRLENPAPYFSTKIKDDNDFVLYVRVRDKSRKEWYLTYIPQDRNNFISGRYIYHYLGSEFKNGSWREIKRNLKEDLQFAGVEFDAVLWYCIRGNYRLDDITLSYTEIPLKTIAYFDGLGRNIQTQNKWSDKNIVQAIDYDAFSRPTKIWKPYITDTDHTYTAKYDDGDGKTGSAGEYYDGSPGADTDNFPYLETKHRNAISEEIQEQAYPGLTYNINSGRTTRYTYASNASGEVDGYGQNELLKTTVTDPNQQQSNEYVDKFGNLILSSQKKVAGEGDRVNLSVTAESFDDDGDVDEKTFSVAFEQFVRWNCRIFDDNALFTTFTIKDQTGHSHVNVSNTDNGAFTAMPGNVYTIKAYALVKGGYFGSVYGNVAYHSAEWDYVSVGFEYDILGNLLKTYHPKAVSDDGKRFLDNNFISQHRYNTLNQLTATVTPDFDGNGNGDPTDETLSRPDIRYKYDVNGNLRFVQDANQQQSNYFTYHSYDAFNRTLRTGTATIPTSSWETLDPSIQYAVELSSANIRVENAYDAADAQYPGARNLKGRLVKTRYKTDQGWGGVWYSYTPEGWVEWLVQDLPGGETAPIKIEYTYDLLGNVIQIIYDRNGDNPFYQWQEYDNLGRLHKVKTNFTNAEPLLCKAQYEYWPTGQVKTLKLKEKRAGNFMEEMEYTYTERDWLQGINSAAPPENPYAISPKFAQYLYYDSPPQGVRPQYNGNIAAASYYTANPQVTSPMATAQSRWHRYLFEYDNLGRLTAADAEFGDIAMHNWFDRSYFDVPSITYDKMGNIETLFRKDETGTGKTFYYRYAEGNRLSWVQNLRDQSGGNYRYDANGNLKTDASKDISHTAYDYRNLPLRININNKGLMEGAYNEAGNRVLKKYTPYGNAYDPSGNYYIYDAFGRAIAVYDLSGRLKFINVYGIDLIGKVY